MATENPYHILSGTAGTNVTANRFAVRAAGDVWNRAGDGVAVHGVFRWTAVAGDEASIMTAGVVVVEAGAAVADNAAVQSNASGQAITDAAGLGVGKVVNGSSAGASGDLISVLLYPVPQA